MTLQYSPIFVLVHGAWHGGWCYTRVAEMLRAAGATVFTPTLTGLGERSHLFSLDINLTAHIADVVNVLRFESLQEVILVGHSYGGMVVTGVAHASSERIAALVYLDAFVPQAGQSLQDLVGMEAAQSLINSAATTSNGGIPAIPAELFNVNEGDRKWVDTLCVTQPPETFTERLPAASGTAILDKTYVLATEHPMGATFREFYDNFSRDREWHTHTLESGHDVMLDKPAETSTILLAVAQRVRAKHARPP